MELEELFSLNIKDKHVLIYEGNDGIICAVVIVRLNSDHLYIDTIEANFDSSIPSNNGASLLLDYMDTAARFLDYDKIILNSLNFPKLKEYYRSHGYVETGNVDVSDSDFGKLIEMEKYLS